MTERAEKLLVTLEGGVKRITINRPERRNSVDGETVRLLLAAIRESADDGTRVVVLTGAGDSFCAGADLAATSAGDIAGFDVTTSLRENVNPTILAMRTLPVPIIARVHGHAVGVGFNYALACDVIVASEQALFGQVFVKIGLMPDGGGTYFLPRLVGYHKAFELIATGEIIGAQEALQLGIVNKVVPVAELDATVDAVAARFAGSPRVAIAKIKAALNRDARAELADALDFEAVNQDACFHSPDFVEGVTAFMQKRKAVFGKAAGESLREGDAG
ncbi:MAG TPA: enoyl-CoA hydratase [Pyrinomonadaceae bacterium]|nr:enoyl-CoA hydratase [Pyrinomonadaceae bacterium]